MLASLLFGRYAILGESHNATTYNDVIVKDD